MNEKEKRAYLEEETKKINSKFKFIIFKISDVEELILKRAEGDK